eukprot:CAMPEP_0197035844 /NCGR_PEP_ID=MMETSP1384-20130603/13516_1 /TAXON_ID=29189 /ORGANISM="Ammonia sp." /LENGTH=794 /DNA_ID=CAMNT_0042465945 /DNA_START=20 /DNA_END=2404 /DNA_ORIENTATION=+
MNKPDNVGASNTNNADDSTNIECVDDDMDTCSITVVINGSFTVKLDPYSSPPSAEELFQAMFHDEELYKAPTHYRQQRWNKRRISKRWSWKRGREREIYEQRAHFLKSKWLELNNDFKANHCKRLSAHFLANNKTLQIDDMQQSKEDLSASPRMLSNLDLNDKDASASMINLNSKLSKKSNANTPSASLSRIDCRRKHLRRKEKLTRRIANGETLDNLVDHEKINHENDNEEDNLLFGGTQNAHHRKSKSKKAKRRNKHNVVAPMKLADFVQAAKQLSNPRKSKHGSHSRTERSKQGQASKADSDSAHNTVSLAAIQAEQTKHFVEETRRKRHEIHCAAAASIASKLKKSGHGADSDNAASNTPPSQKHTNVYRHDAMYHYQHTDTSLTSSPRMISVENSMNEQDHTLDDDDDEDSLTVYNAAQNQDVNVSLMEWMKIRNYSFLQYRQNMVEEIYKGSSVFACIPFCNESCNTLLVDASFVENLLKPHVSLSTLSGLFELKKRLKKQFRNKVIAILPIFERAYIDQPCRQCLLIQFQDIMHEDAEQHAQNPSQCGDNINCALTLYHIWKQQIQQMDSKERGNMRVEFVQKWFANAYVLQHSHLWSNVALDSMITVYDNNARYIPNVNSTARHCRCSQQRVVYFPPFDLSDNKDLEVSHLPKHDTHCALNCCCCVFYDGDRRSNSNSNSEDGQVVRVGDIVLWNARKCVVDANAVNGSEQDCKIQIDGVKGIFVVPASSLQIINELKACKSTAERHMFDAQKQMSDDMSFVFYMKRFWNIPEMLCTESRMLAQQS